jgi:glutamate carboxypeptidase
MAATTLSATLGVDDDEARSRVLERVRRYVEIETPSGDEAALNELAGIVARDAEALGGRVERHAAPGFGTNLLITFDGGVGVGGDDGKAVVVLTHIDTVHPAGTLETQPFRVRGDRAEGPGVYDMKCGLVLVLEARATLRARGARPARPVRLLVTCDEEIGSHSSYERIVQLARGAAAVLVPEPSVPGGGVKTARKGVATFDLHVTGRAAHAGIEPGRAVSAISEIALQIVELLELADHERGTTVNVGTISGGTATNVVAAAARAGIDVRSVDTGEAARVRAGLERLAPKLAGAAVRVELKEQRPPLERTAAVVRLYEHARALAAELGVELAEGSTGGGSDGSITAAAGAPTLDGLGADGGGAHATDEHVLLADLPFRVALFTRLFETL